MTFKAFTMLLFCPPTIKSFDVLVPLLMILSSAVAIDSSEELDMAVCTTVNNAFGFGCDYCPATKAVNCSGPALNVTSIMSRLTNESLNHISIVGANVSTISYLSTSTLLQQLALDANGIRGIDVGAFRGLVAVEKLSLERNFIRFLKPGTFRGLVKLKVLNLGGNQLYVVDVGVFSPVDVPSLIVLDLRECRINEFYDRALANLRQLATVNLTGNRLSVFPPFGNGLDKLADVYLSSNKIESLDGNGFPFPGPTAIHLDKNEIRKLGISSIFALSRASNRTTYRLRELILSENQISSIETGSLSGLNQLKFIDLSGNRLTVVDDLALPWTSLNKVFVDDNPWSCMAAGTAAGDSDDALPAGANGCVNSWLVNQPDVKRWNQNIICSSPQKLVNVSVYQALSRCAVDAGSSSGRQGAALYVSLTLITLTAMVVFGLAVVFRRRWKRQHRPLTTNSSPPFRTNTKSTEAVCDDDEFNWSSTSVSYRQMEDLTPGTFTADQNEL